ncbi:MAG: tRNA lysidine(34) synthetase TilS [Verrucomicrobiaceae bacterium]|nr:tRNA lysidine(34) synthetase TilS [Verrucomicrobiaceae bacterium]
MDIVINDITFDVDLNLRALNEISAYIEEGACVGVACSGGADSVFALLSLLDIFKGNRDSIKVLHYNHKARISADNDMAFVKDMCEKLGVDAYFGEPENPPEKHSEDEFRKLRISFFEDICKRENIAIVVQGHHSSDASETVLMRLSRGSGLEGLCAPAPISDAFGVKFVRPLLEVSKVEIISILRSAGVMWCEDETNAQNSYFRNRIRNIVLPVIEEVAPNFYTGVRRTQRLLAEDLHALNSAFEDIFVPINLNLGTTARLCAEIVGCRSYLRRAVMRLLAHNNELENIRSHAVDKFLDDVYDSFLSESTISVKTPVGDKILVYTPRSFELGLYDSKPVDEFCIEAGIGTHILPDGRALRIRKITLGTEKRLAILNGENDDSTRAILDVSCFGDIKKDTLTLRTRREGDAYAPLGRSTPKKLKDILNAKKVPILKRKSILVVCNKNGEILWVPPAAPADKYKITNSSVAIELTLEE